MKTWPTLLLSALVLSGSAFAQESFPGLKAILSAEEWKRAGLERLTPDEIGVIDAALIRQQARATAHLQGEVTAARTLAATSAAAASSVAPAPTKEPKRGWMARFGLPVSDDDWRDVPPLKAKVVAWESANRFRLDNGQVWEGFDAIPYELVGQNIEIQARPANRYALAVEGRNTTIRVMRLR